jgi:hypothetical protein
MEGDTLVVDVTGFNDRAGLDRPASHSDACTSSSDTRTAPDVIGYEDNRRQERVHTALKISMPLYCRLEKGVPADRFQCAEFAEELLVEAVAQDTDREFGGCT